MVTSQDTPSRPTTLGKLVAEPPCPKTAPLRLAASSPLADHQRARTSFVLSFPVICSSSRGREGRLVRWSGRLLCGLGHRLVLFIAFLRHFASAVVFF